MKRLKFIGGAKLGGVNYTWPLVKLEISQTHLILKTIFLTKYKFLRKDIDTIENVSWLPIVAEGIRIRHHLKKYPNQIIFWTFTPKKLIDQLKLDNYVNS
ncbi:hypothetical protein [Psychroflexus tropicus]|uniref:hypothetical protein n=1 Tax=Psychroflexus tropicus TaxID=197345 RepID=UPI00036A8552|nr:hypothetical protein [Psychroflexus tropicus]